MKGKDKSPQERGKDFESDFQALLKSMHQRLRANYYRFYDTRSAGAYMPSQPADYFLGFQGVMHFFELKSSEKHASLANGLSSLMDKDQAAHLRLWARAGAGVHVLFLNQVSGAVEWWNGLAVSSARAAGKAIKPLGICMQYPDFATFEKLFEEQLVLNPSFWVASANQLARQAGN
jgi:hypothetical protein